ncbi:Hypothetical protein GLP15_1311 [Giardia lamblia P15]|uniref:Condensin complex subunit 2 n=1 Tax=Giardia intestinalis (strain P15) TaxID=658858 RepID=E1F892_GIAIA|nr:Hypothetical protein GLP15_1311 [Giardia lamblia P15]
MSQLEQILVDCLALAAQDKITAKNSWSLQLLENIDGIIDSMQQSCDFVYVSSAISASAKIYAGRVDSLYTMVRHTAAAGRVHDHSPIDLEGEVDANSSQARRSLDKHPKAARRGPYKNTALTKDFSALQMKPASRDALFRLDPLYSQLQMQELTCTTRSLPIFDMYAKPATLSVSQALSDRILANVRPITTHMIQAAQASLIATPLVAPSGSLDRSLIMVNPTMQSQYGNFSSRIESAVHSVSNSLILSQELQDDVARYVETSDNLSITEDLIAVSGKNALWSAAKLPKPLKKQRVARRAASQSSKKSRVSNPPRAPRAPRSSSSTTLKPIDHAPPESVEIALSDCSINLEVDELDLDPPHTQGLTNSRRATLEILDLHGDSFAEPTAPFDNSEYILNMVKTESLIDSTPTKVNIAQLKGAIHNELTHQTTLTKIFTQLPRMKCLPSDITDKSAAAISLVFSALLHLASEGHVGLEHHQDDINIVPQC